SLKLSGIQSEISRLETRLEGDKARRLEILEDQTKLDTKLTEMNAAIQATSTVVVEAELEKRQFEISEGLENLRREKTELDSEWIEKRIEFGAVEERLERLNQQSISAEMTKSEYAHNQSIYLSDIEQWKTEIAREEGRVENLKSAKEGAHTDIQ